MSQQTQHAARDQAALFRAVCRDCEKAWEIGRLVELSRPEKVAMIRDALRNSNAKEAAEFFIRMAWMPYSNVDPGQFNDGKATQLSEHLMCAMFEPYVRARDAYNRKFPNQKIEIDLRDFLDSVVLWIEKGGASGFCLDESADGRVEGWHALREISRLPGLEGTSARMVLCAPFAAPLTFARLAIDLQLDRDGQRQAALAQQRQSVSA